jgi:hypothetical protein
MQHISLVWGSISARLAREASLKATAFIMALIVKADPNK